MTRFEEKIVGPCVRFVYRIAGRVIGLWWQITDKALVCTIRDTKDDEEARRIVREACKRKYGWFKD